MSIRACSRAAIALGQDSVDTRSNAEEVARWLARRRYRSIRLVTNDVHMRRARYEIGKQGRARTSASSPTRSPTSPDLRQIFVEYNKFCSAGPPACSGSEAAWRRCARSCSPWSSTAARCRRSCSPSRSACSAPGRCGGWAHVWVRFHRWCARYLLGIRTRVEGAPPAGACLVAVKHQSMFETFEIILMLDQPAMVLKRELVDIPLWGWVVRPLRRHPDRPHGRRGGAAADDARRRGGDRRGAADRDLPGRDAGDAGRAAAAQIGLRRPLPGAEAAGRAGRGEQRPARGRAAASSSEPGIVTMRFAPPIPPGLPRGEIEAAVHARDQRAGARR